MAQIILYADDFPSYVWEEYCDICKEGHDAISLTINFDANKDVGAKYEEVKDESCIYVCNICGKEFECEDDEDFDSYVEEELWWHLQMDHEEEFDKCVGSDTSDMIDEYYGRKDD